MATLSQKNDRLYLRIQKSQKNFLMYAASLCRMNLSSFVLHSAFKTAEEIVTEKAHFALSKKQWQDFCEALDRPAKSIPELKSSFQRKQFLMTKKQSFKKPVLLEKHHIVDEFDLRSEK